MSGFTDYHAHFVYGVDDGAQTREEMYTMLDAAGVWAALHPCGTNDSTKTDRTGGHRVSCIVALTAGNENGKDASFSQLLHEETDGEGTSFCKEVWSFWLFVQKNLRIKGQSVKLKQRTCMVDLRGCTNEDTGRR